MQQIKQAPRLLSVAGVLDDVKSHPGAAQQDASAAWEGVYVRTRPSLVRALAAATGSYEGVEDAIQEAFAEAISRAPMALRSTEAWLYVVALNRLRSQRRRVRFLRHLRLAPPSGRSEIDDALARADIQRVLGALTQRERELLVAKHYIGMTQEEIAQQMRLSRGTVSAAISRAAARFRQLEGRR
jgi:RNA polymerase sigma factor (sigma-70 family)